MALKKDVDLNSVIAKPLTLKVHSDYIAAYGENKEDYEYCMTEYLRMSGIYWGLTAMALMGELDRMNKGEVLQFVRSCQDPVSGGISSSPGHDPHLLYTLSALQILSIYDEKLSDQEQDKVVNYIKSLQQPSGSFIGDKWGEEDTRFSFCAVACLSLIGRLNDIDVEKATEFVVSCMNFDGGFGSRPGSESHAGLIYCCVGYFSVVGRLDLVDADTLGWWLCERQLPSALSLLGESTLQVVDPTYCMPKSVINKLRLAPQRLNVS
ncbi:Hypothetical predicted protein [Cloeon dipterum]|uniref:Geranylgeranyl transferase type-2 subunit beta n=1 Tax=Cloeon dipterum TaxID=197152 RepID=A0A8S1BIH9_9INSE|nr:Hypothetical predicted protein [Cloeon dipterum]